MGNKLAKVVDPLHMVSGDNSLLGEFTGSNAAARAAGAAAAAQLAQQKEDRAAAVKAANSPEELQQIQQTIQLNNQDIKRKEAILASTDPAVIEAGKQTLALLQGKEAATLNPIRNQRMNDRAKLQAKLQKQLGPGWETSSAGITALNQFDSQTGDLLANAQQNTINSLMGTASAFSANGLNSNIANTGTIANMFGNIAGRNVNAITGNQIDPGLAFAGDMAKAQAQGQNFSTLLQVGGTIAGAMAGGPAGAAMGSQAGSTLGGMMTPYQGVSLGQGAGGQNFTFSNNKASPWSFQ